MEWTWDLSIFYQGFDDPQIEKDFAQVRALIAQGNETLDASQNDQETLNKMVDIFEQASALIENLGNFSNLTLATEATNEPAAQMMDKLMQMSVDVELLSSKFIRYLAGVKNLEELIAGDERLKKVDFALLNDKEQAEHLLPEEIEPWMLKMSLTGADAFSQLRDKLDATLLVDFEGEQLPLSAVRAKAYDKSAQVRQAAYQAELAAYKKIDIPMAACLNSVKGESLTMCEARKYPSVLDMTLAQSNMDKETIDAMFTAIDESLPKFRAYLRKKGEMLGHKNGLPFYDLFAPVAAEGYEPPKFTVEEARAKLLTEMGKFSKDMASFIDNAFEQRWIDMYPRAGKGGGAFCSTAHAHKMSRVLTNFAGSFSDVSTLAHELGHAWHDRQMSELPFMMINTPMPLAETASIFNETLLAHAARSQASKEEAFTLLEGELMENTQTIVDIYSRYLFESAVIEGRKDHALSVPELNAAMLEAQEKTYGDGLDAQTRHPYMWACKCHYYFAGLNFYNFPYAFGMLFGKGMFAKYLEKGAEFVPEYNKLLSLCGSAKVADVTARVGIDVHSVDFWRASLKVVTDDVDEFIRLADELA